MKTLKVSQLNASIKQLLEGNFKEVWVEGEISNLRVYNSGHLYFTLKDEDSQIRAVMFCGLVQTLSSIPKDGDAVIVKASVGLYAPRGEYQLIVRQLSPVGIGELYQRFIDMKNELQRLGWFEDAIKKTIPAFPQTVGVITSPSGAAIQDIINITTRRAPWVKLIIYPTLVQGAQAAAQIAGAINLANQRKECDLLIVGRGGGSLEDLWPFNELAVARAILESKVPIISAVGHETDFSISDFVADLRAPTPSAAAELATAKSKEIIGKHLRHYRDSWIAKISGGLRDFAYRLNLSRRGFTNLIRHVHDRQNYMYYKQQQLVYKIRDVLHGWQQRLDRGTATLMALNPEQVMQRGYAIIRQNRQIVVSCQQARVGQDIEIRWQDGIGVAKLLSIQDKR